MTRIAGAVLAAGSGTRMGQPKGTLVVAGHRLVDRAVSVLAAAGCDPVVAVVRDGVEVPGANAVVNPDPDRGIRSSLELAVDATAGNDVLALLLADTPGVQADAVRAVIAAWRPGRIARARYPGGRGHPVVMERPLWREALDRDSSPDEGAGLFLYLHPHLIDEVRVTGDPTDLDTPEDLARWTGR